MSQSVETQLALLAHQMMNLTKVVEDVAHDQKDINLKFTDWQFKQQSSDGDIRLIKEQLASNAPTIQEFVTIKHKVQGAGALGKFIWASGGALLATIAFFRKQLIEVMSGS